MNRTLQLKPRVESALTRPYVAWFLVKHPNHIEPGFNLVDVSVIAVSLVWIAISLETGCRKNVSQRTGAGSRGKNSTDAYPKPVGAI